MTGTPFVQYDIQLRVGQTLISPQKVSEASILKAVAAHNESVDLEGLPFTLNRESLDPVKVRAWYAWVLGWDASLFEQIRHKILYLNNPEYRLSPPEPTRPESYGKEAIPTIPPTAGKLVMTKVAFGTALVPDTALLEEAQAFFTEKDARIQEMEADAATAGDEEDHEALNQLYESLVIEKYCRFTALAVWQSHLEAMKARGIERENLAGDLAMAAHLFQAWMVPPIR
ncbi:MAG: hypothetical protein D6722_19480 [Bacteroidetes bacterium]|nr:MAG: hypothetical protein D6722_19480 [Bacteroidota bacterium]